MVNRLWRRAYSALPRKWSGLRARMSISYVAVTLGSVLAFMLLGVLASGAFAAIFSESDTRDFLVAMQRQAQSYALIAAMQSHGATLNARANFVPGQPYSLILPNERNEVFPIITSYGSSAGVNGRSVALLLGSTGRVVASTNPSRYPMGMSIFALTRAQRNPLGEALAGMAIRGTEQASAGAGLGFAAEPVWSSDHLPIGAVFLQAPLPTRASGLAALANAALSNLTLLVLVTPIGLFFGWVTTRGPVRRVRRLALAATQFAEGDYTQRITLTQDDELGQLERQFNQMEDQLVEHIARRQQLAEQNARLEERARISRELHDAISQDLFSLRLLADGLQEAARTAPSSADLRPQITLLEQTTENMTREMRALLLELRPTQLERLGLAGALDELAQAYRVRLGIAVDADVTPLPLDVKTEHALLRIAQESLANAARHSNATRVSLRLARADAGADGDRDAPVTLTISDDGAGFAADGAASGHGLGLRLMQERAAELGGTFQLTTAPGEGAIIAVSVPQERACD